MGQAGKENQTPTNGIQTPTKDGVCKQPSQAAKKKTLQAGRESQAHTMLFVKHCRDSVGRNSTPLHLAPSFINQAQTATKDGKHRQELGLLIRGGAWLGIATTIMLI